MCGDVKVEANDNFVRLRGETMCIAEPRNFPIDALLGGSGAQDVNVTLEAMLTMGIRPYAHCHARHTWA